MSSWHIPAQCHPVHALPRWNSLQHSQRHQQCNLCAMPTWKVCRFHRHDQLHALPRRHRIQRDRGSLERNVPEVPARLLFVSRFLYMHSLPRWQLHGPAAAIVRARDAQRLSLLHPRLVQLPAVRRQHAVLQLCRARRRGVPPAAAHWLVDDARQPRGVRRRHVRRHGLSGRAGQRLRGVERVWAERTRGQVAQCRKLWGFLLHGHNPARSQH